MRPLATVTALGLVLTACGGADPPADAGAGDAGPACTTSAACGDGIFCNGAERCDPSGCAPSEPPCLPSQTCDETASACVTNCESEPDADGDGARAMACGGDDCDDADPARAPGEPERCDDADIDEDCDPATFGDRDADRDGYIDVACCNGTTCGTDCDDAVATVHPTEGEACNRVDDDCDGAVDEGVRVPLWRDADGDMFGDGRATPADGCPGLDLGLASNPNDCDDGNAARNPTSIETCNGIDDDCDGLLDGPGEDDDRDRHPAECSGVAEPDCDDDDASVHPGALEVCELRDTDCSSGGGTDPGEDADLDGHPPPGRCEVLPGALAEDCDDTSFDTNPRAPERCGGADEDCDGTVDEAAGVAAWCNRMGTIGECVGGACTITGCAAPFANCNGLPADGCEADTSSDTENCSACGARCPWSGTCTAGVCGCPASLPVLCGAMPGGCIDTSTDFYHCGACYAPCPTGATCTGGVCRCPGATTPCGGACVDTSSSVVHCGGCDRACTGGSCEGGTCRCPGATPAVCGGTCRDLAVDEAHCGACGTTCTGGTCTGGACSCPPAAPTLCAGACTDLLSARGACGACDHVCGLSSCTAGACDEVVDLAAGYLHTCAVRASGTVVCWGLNHAGQLGVGDTIDRAIPAVVSDLSDARRVAAATTHTCVARATGAVSCWGNNAGGQLGRGYLGGPPVLYPADVADISDAVEVSTTDAATCARRTGATVSCWGLTWQVGGATGDTSRPVAVAGLAGVAKITSGREFTCAMRSAGTVACWGRASEGQLGNGSTTAASAAPGEVVGLTDAVDVSARGEHTCAVRAGGTVVCWGYAPYGGIGGGDGVTLLLVPGTVAGVTGAVRAGVGRNHSCVVLVDGTVRCWGDNFAFQMGIGDDRTMWRVPGPAMSGRRATLIVAGDRHSCILEPNGAVECAGDNESGSVGVGVLPDRYVKTPTLPIAPP